MELTLSGIGYWSGPWDVLNRKEIATKETKTLQKQRGLLPLRCFIKCKINIQRARQKVLVPGCENEGFCIPKQKRSLWLGLSKRENKAENLCVHSFLSKLTQQSAFKQRLLTY